MNTTIQEKQTKLLEETANFYNSRNRSTNVIGQCACQYSASAFSPGCAIGRWLPEELSYKMDVEYRGASIYSMVKIPEIWDQFPSELKELGVDFLFLIQDLHDNSCNWEQNGLSFTGKNRVEFIKDSILSGDFLSDN